MDYELFFGTRGALTPIGLNGLVIIVYLNGLLSMVARKTEDLIPLVILLPALGILGAVCQFVYAGIRRLLVACHPLCRRARKLLVAWSPLCRWISLWSPMVAIALLGPCVPGGDNDDPFAAEKSVGWWTIYAVLLLAVLMVTISRMEFPGIIKLADYALGDKQECWRRLVLSLCMIGAIGHWDRIPTAIVRVVLPLIRLIQHNYNTPCKENAASSTASIPAPAPSDDNAKANLAPSLGIFYGMVLGQGALYLVACGLEVFSFIPRRCLVRRAGFRGQWGVDSVKMYYKYAMQKCMERNVLASNVLAPEISLCNFAIDSLNSDSTKRQLHGIRIVHILLQRDPATRTRLLVKLTAEMMTRLLRMLDWTGQGHETIRLVAVKVIDELARDLLIVTVPGIVQNVSLLLDCAGNHQKRGNPLLDTEDEQEQQNYLSVDGTSNNQMEIGEAVPDTRNLHETQAYPTQQVGTTNTEHNSWIARRWRQVFEFWSIPQEGPLTEQDLLPVLGMSIIENLATYDRSNCEEIDKATDLIRKITRFTRYCKSDTKCTTTEKRALVDSSLKLFHRLTSISGEVGITLRQKISTQPFLLRNLSDILGDTTSCNEARKLAAGIIRNLAVDASTRHTFGRVQVIITRLMRAFLTPEDGDRFLRKVAGQALAMLAMGNVDNCRAMLSEDTGYSIVKELTNMIQVVRYKCVAASLLRSVCMLARPELKEEDLEALSRSSREVLEIILREEGAELEIFIGLSSYIYIKPFPRSLLEILSTVRSRKHL
ncbi:hypothetical protein HU200_045969 [Digitaria exilis]|uniref:ARM repeat superfamily protein n=1 Tax=Digitaria exilis TaxID=1010633 RepID=A0A835AZS7_9POAL|nr:hypothetical protein HU200_045969 [Digitaria exilis]